MVCEGLLLVRAYCLSALMACQGLLLVRAYCRLLACLLTHSLSQQLQIVTPLHCFAVILEMCKGWHGRLIH